MKKLLTALKNLHEVGVLHRDVKPENLLIKCSEKSPGKFSLKLIDFGIASNITDSVRKVCGTPGYVAPEVFHANEKGAYNEKCDIFSAGIIFYELLNKGRMPFEG